MITLKNKKETSYIKLDGDGIVYVDIKDDSLAISFRVIKGDRHYIENFKERIIDTHNKILEDEFNKKFDNTFNAIKKLKDELNS